MASGPGMSNRESTYYIAAGQVSDPNPFLSNYYTGDAIDMQSPKPETIQNQEGTQTTHTPKSRKGRPSIFNRYCLFYYNSIEGHGPENEPYMDAPNRLSAISAKGAAGWQSVIDNPSAKNLINWSMQGGANRGTNAIEYAWEDFLWCKNYGQVPNNYMVTLRRFHLPVTDDLLDTKKQPSPDIGRMIAWVDGESNTWESVGLKFSTSLTWKKLESEIQSVQAQPGWGNESGMLPGMLGNVVKAFSSVSEPGQSEAVRSYNPATANIDPYATKNITYGPIDVVKEMMVRDKGVNFEQQMTLKFEYELRSIDGINPKVAMIDLISNVLVCTANRAQWWGGEIRYYGGDPRQIKPLGNPQKLAEGNLGGYFDSLVSGISSRLKNLTGGAGLTPDGVANALKNIGGALMDNIIGGGLDKMGRPGAQALQALLSGEDTGEWHVMVGNPANPIISVGNLILEKTDLYLHGALGADDFPSKLTVTCTLKPARPRDRTDIMSMFHRNGRTYVQEPPTAKKYAGNKRKGGQNGGTIPKGSIQAFSLANVTKNLDLAVNGAANTENFGYDSSIRFANFTGDKASEVMLDWAAQGIY